MRWWMDKGCDGFRVRQPRLVISFALIYLWFTQMDVINMISKVDGLPDAEVTQPERGFSLGTSILSTGVHLSYLYGDLC